MATKHKTCRGKFPLGWLSTTAILIILANVGLGFVRTSNQLFSLVNDGIMMPTSTVAASLHVLSASFPSSEETEAVGDMKKFTKYIRSTGIFPDKNVHLFRTMPTWITSDPRWSRHLRFLKNATDDSSRGAGYKFWKPVLLLHLLQDPFVRDGDFVVYADPNRNDILQWITLFREIMTFRKADLALEQFARFLERRYSKPEVYYHYSCRQNLDEEGAVVTTTKPRTWQLEAASDVTMQYDSSFVMIRRNAKTLQFVQDWVEAAARFELISDEKLGLTGTPDFEGHRHDQSLLSLLLKCKYGEPAKTLILNNTVLNDSGESYTFSFQLDNSVM